jgi:nicotinamide-nucleotide amidase
MQAEIIALGTELTNGSKLDTNSQWLSTELAALGVEVVRHATIGDSMSDMVEALQLAAKRVQFVVITGGLGPTLDDLTRQAMADAAGVELELHQPSLDVIEEMFKSRGRVMPARNQIQAMFPAGSKPVLNPRGTAPGIDMEVSLPDHANKCRFVALPGVPSEMKPMFRETIAPSLSGTGVVIRKSLINCFGAGESGIEEMLGDLTARGREPEVGITASDATITMRIVARADSADACDACIQETKALIIDKLGDLVFGYADERLPDVVVRQLVKRGQSVSVVERLTAGRVSEWLHACDETGTCVQGGLVLANEDPPPGLIPASALGSIRELADHARELFKTDHAIAVGRLSDSAVPIAVSSASGTTSAEITVVGNPAIRQSRIAKAAINMLRLRLLSSERNAP